MGWKRPIYLQESHGWTITALVESTYPLNAMKPVDMNPVRMRIVEDAGDDKVITYFDVLEVDKKYYYVYNDVNHGPYHEFDDAVEAASEDLIP